MSVKIDKNVPYQYLQFCRYDVSMQHYKNALANFLCSVGGLFIPVL